MERFVEDHPWEIVAAAAILGAWVAGNPGRFRFVFRIAKAYASRKLGDLAFEWLEQSKVSAHGEPDAGRQYGQAEPAHP